MIEFVVIWFLLLIDASDSCMDNIMWYMHVLLIDWCWIWFLGLSWCSFELVLIDGQLDFLWFELVYNPWHMLNLWIIVICIIFVCNPCHRKWIIAYVCTLFVNRLVSEFALYILWKKKYSNKLKKKKIKKIGVFLSIYFFYLII